MTDLVVKIILLIVIITVLAFVILKELKKRRAEIIEKNKNSFNFRRCKMRFGKFRFNSFKEFQQLQNLAIANGVGTVEEFEKFLSENCSDKIVKK